MKVLKGIDGLKRHVLHEAYQPFRSSPILLVTSESLSRKADSSPDHPRNRRGKGCKSVSDACRRVQFLLQQQLALRCIAVEACPDPSQPYPTLAHVKQVRDLAARASAASSVVVGVGSGAAIDLAKALTQNRSSSAINNEAAPPTLVLVPATYSAVMVSASSHALVLDPPEATLVATERADDPSTRTVVQLDSHQMSLHNLRSSLLAAMALLLDQARVKGPSDKIRRLLGVLSHALSTREPKQDGLWEVLLETGREARYGTTTATPSTRSVPLAVAASLAPASDHLAVAIMADTAPFLADLIREESSVLAHLDPNSWIDVRQQPGKPIFGPPDGPTLESLLSHIRGNRSLHSPPCRDDEAALRLVLSSLIE